MKKFVSHFVICTTVIIALLAATAPASANACASKAQAVASQANATLLSAKPSGGKCVITMRVPGKNGKPPRIVTRTVNG